MLFSTILTNPAFGNYVDLATAKTVATNFYIEKALQGNHHHYKSVSANDIVLTMVHREFEDPTVTKNDTTSIYYIFNVNDENGYIIVSADDEITPVLGYALSGAYNEDESLPDAFAELLSYYKAQIVYVKSNDLKAASNVNEQWAKYLSDNSLKNISEIESVSPLLTTTWSQGCYYNESCPIDERGPCGHVVVGCVAVAMAQIMNYWQYPDIGNNISGYTDKVNYSDGNVIPNSSYGEIPDIPLTAYDWSAMEDNLTSDNPSVATLLYHSGVSLQMNYSPTSSSTSTARAASALENYFYYSSSITYYSKSRFSDSEWKAMMKQELDQGRPILYRGASENSSYGHAFVCDGYQDTDYFHFNWGWNGYYDGYFYLEDLTPQNFDFSYYQLAVIYIYPPLNHPIIEYQTHEIDDDSQDNSSGDDDRFAEPGESIELSVMLENNGYVDANNVSAVLSTTDPYIIITEDTQYWGTISPGYDSNSSGFSFTIASDCPDKDVTFSLGITSDEGSWIEQFTEHVYDDITLQINTNVDVEFVKIFPNPVKEGSELNVEISTIETYYNDGYLNVFNINGQVVYSENKLQPKMTIKGLYKGSYLVWICFPNNYCVARKLMVK